MPLSESVIKKANRHAISTESERPEGECDNGDDQETAIMEEESNRQIMRLLEPGDVVLETFNSARIMGLDLCGEIPFFGPFF